MKLGEALKRLEAVKSSVSLFYSYLSVTPRDALTSLLKKISELLEEEMELEKRIDLTESKPSLEGNSIANLRRGLVNLDKKIEVLDKVMHREDVSEEEKSKLMKDIMSFTESRDTLLQLVEKYLWEVELL